MPLVFIIEETHMRLRKEFVKIYQRRRGKKKMVKQLSTKIINWVGRKVLALFSHFYSMIYMRCVANYNHSKAYSNGRNRMFEAPWSWLPLATTFKGLQYGAFNNCERGQPLKWVGGIFFCHKSITVGENWMLSQDHWSAMAVSLWDA